MNCFSLPLCSDRKEDFVTWCKSQVHCSHCRFCVGQDFYL